MKIKEVMHCRDWPPDSPKQKSALPIGVPMFCYIGLYKRTVEDAGLYSSRGGLI